MVADIFSNLGPHYYFSAAAAVISTLYLHRRHMAPVYGRMIVLLRIFKKYQSKK